MIHCRSLTRGSKIVNSPTASNKLQEFRDAATISEWETLAWYADTSVAYLRHLTKRYGNRTPSVTMAYRIECGTKLLKANNRKLPIVTCRDIAEFILNTK
jgi:hypothetical protein